MTDYTNSQYIYLYEFNYQKNEVKLVQNLHLKNSSKVLVSGGLQDIIFALVYRGIKRRKCVLMIQPVNALSPRAVFRGSAKSYASKKSSGLSDSNIALLNAGGVAAAVGGITTAVARGYTSSWAHSAVLGMFGAFLSLFFMAPQLIEKSATKRLAKGGEGEIATKSKAEQLIKVAEEHLKPAKKLVQFRSDGTPAQPTS